jgi:hypothetical protein
MTNKPNGKRHPMALEQDMALAKALMDRGELDEAEHLLDKIEMVQKAMAADDAEDDEDDTDGTDNDGDEDEEDDGDEDDNDIAKSFRENNNTYPRDDLTDPMNEHRQVEHPQYSTHASREKFQQRVAAIAHRDGCPLTVAMQRARGEMGADHIAELRQPISAVKKLGLPKTPPLRRRRPILAVVIGSTTSRSRRERCSGRSDGERTVTRDSRAARALCLRQHLTAFRYRQRCRRFAGDELHGEVRSSHAGRGLRPHYGDADRTQAARRAVRCLSTCMSGHEVRFAPNNSPES